VQFSRGDVNEPQRRIQWNCHIVLNGVDMRWVNHPWKYYIYDGLQIYTVSQMKWCQHWNPFKYYTTEQNHSLIQVICWEASVWLPALNNFWHSFLSSAVLLSTTYFPFIRSLSRCILFLPRVAFPLILPPIISCSNDWRLGTCPNHIWTDTCAILSTLIDAAGKLVLLWRHPRYVLIVPFGMPHLVSGINFL